jgi:hypothetical protein
MGLETNYLKFINSVISQASGKRMLELGNQSLNHSKRPEKTGNEYFTNNGFEHISVDRNGLDGAVKKDLRNISQFREYVDFFHGINLPKLSISELLESNQDMKISKEVPEILRLFKQYLMRGYFPFSKIFTNDVEFYQAVQQ